MLRQGGGRRVIMTKKALKTKLFKLVAIATAISCIGTFSGCGNKTADGEKNAELKYIMTGPGMQNDSNEVWEEFNKQLAEKIPGVKVDFEIISGSEFNQRYLLMRSAREKMDIVNNYGLDFATEVKNGSFIELDSLIEEYGQETVAALPEWFMDYQKIDGKIYGVPSYQMCAVLRGVTFIKEQADKYLDMDAFKKALYATKHDSRELYDILEKYMDDLSAAGYKFNGSAKVINLRGWENLAWPYGIAYGDENGKIENTATNELGKLRNEVSKRWRDKGYIKEDALTDTTDYKGQPDGVPFWDVGYTPFIQDKLSAEYGIDVIVVPYYEKDYIGYRNSAGGTSISSSCEAPEKAMQVINLLQSDKDMFNLLTFGIEGKHYTKAGEDQINTPYSLQAGTTDAYGLFKWIVGNTELAYNCPSEPVEYKKWVFEESNKSDYISPLIGFNFDNSKVADYLTQVNYVNEKYYESLLAGAHEDWEATFEQYKKELDEVGNQEIMAEMQRQIDEFLKAKN